jgi:hypothetical protein
VAVVTRLERKSRRWEQVWQSDSEAIASIVAGRLQAEGIRVRIEGNATPYRGAAFTLGGTWAILVPAGRSSLAREMLRENDEGHNVIDAELGDGLTSSQKSTIGFVLVLVVTMAVFLAVATARGG